FSTISIANISPISYHTFSLCFFSPVFLKDPATSDIYTLSLHDALPIFFEPKDEKWAWAFELPELRPLMNLVSLSTSVRDKGKLDPLLALGKDPRMREDANERQYVTDFALTLLLYLAGEPDTSLAGQAIGYAVDETLKHDDHPTLMRVIH